MVCVCVCVYVSTQLIGLGMVACGAWFHASHDVHAYLTIFVNSAHDSSMLASAALMLVAGLVLTLISALAIAGILLNKPLFVYIVRISLYTPTFARGGLPLPSSVHHLSIDDCLEDKRENYQNCSVLCCVRLLITMICTHI